MDQATAERWVTISALVVMLVYGYRRITEPAQKGTVKNLLGQSPPVTFGQFVTAWGFMFFVISIVAEASPSVGGSFAILVGTADLLNNLQPALADVKKQESGPTAQDVNTATAGAATTAPISGTNVPYTTGSQGFSSPLQHPYQNVTGPVTAPVSPTAPQTLPSSGPYGGGLQP